MYNASIVYDKIFNLASYITAGYDIVETCSIVYIT